MADSCNSSCGSSSSSGMSVYLKKRIEEQIVEDKSCKDLLETNMSRVKENMKRREEIFNLLSGMKESSVREVAMMFMVDLESGMRNN
ncbi:hypothetical protein HanIR_Chr14g0705111 [Helianthus annuus]|nr:hypothetical protein HanIR_Chr14g0705111 [Helianthus annuus]